MKSILVVDDELDFTRALNMVLGLEGYSVTTVHDGVQGLAALAQAQPDLLLLDIMLPRKSGIDVLNELRADSRFRNLPVILMSGALPDVAKLKAQGPLEFLHKPFTFDQLRMLVRRLVGNP